MSEEFSKEELEKRMHDKNVEMLRSEGGLESLLIFNLENFAYRYLETANYKDIKCKSDAKGDLWVESFEEDILVALKWKNEDLKKGLIDLCKLYPGAKSKELKVKLLLGTKIVSDSEVQCYSQINWDYPHFDYKSEKSISKKENFSFDDPILLRNIHAAILERMAEIF